MRLSFTVDGQALSIEPGRELPGLPALHVVTPDGKHVSLAYPVRSGAGYLFDLGKGCGYYVDVATATATPYPSASAYYEARNRAGWPCRKRGKVAAQ